MAVRTPEPTIVPTATAVASDEQTRDDFLAPSAGEDRVGGVVIAPSFRAQGGRLPDKIPSVGLYFDVPYVSQEDCEVHAPSETSDEMGVLTPDDPGYVEYVSLLLKMTESMVQDTPTPEQVARITYLGDCLERSGQ